MSRDADKISSNPWRSLAAAICLRAVDDCKLVDLPPSCDPKRRRSNEDYIREAREWLEHSEWCEILLEYAGIGISGKEVLRFIKEG